MASIEVSPAYGYVILTIVALLIEYFAITVWIVLSVRAKVFSNKFLEDYFGDEHKKYFSCSVPDGGYPDMGNGRYSQKLSYSDWVTFNNAQRVHYNFLEQLPMLIPLILLAGLYSPMYTTISGVIYIVVRAIYTLIYVKKGAQARFPAVGIMGLCTHVLMAMSVLEGLRLINGVP